MLIEIAFMQKSDILWLKITDYFKLLNSPPWKVPGSGVAGAHQNPPGHGLGYPHESFLEWELVLFLVISGGVRPNPSPAHIPSPLMKGPHPNLLIHRCGGKPQRLRKVFGSAPP